MKNTVYCYRFEVRVCGVYSATTRDNFTDDLDAAIEKVKQLSSNQRCIAEIRDNDAEFPVICRYDNGHLLMAKPMVLQRIHKA